MIAPVDTITIFMSYAHADRDFVKEVARMLSEIRPPNGMRFEVLVDWRDLPFGEEWQSELLALIERADAIVFMASPASVGSKWCAWELDQVQRLSKRLVPVMITDLPSTELPASLGKRQVLPMLEHDRNAPQFHAALAALVKTLWTDNAWIKEHTRLGDRARQWSAKARDTSLLLSGRALRDAERWIDTRPLAAPAPSEDILELVLASRRAGVRRQRGLIVGALTVATFAVALSSIAYLQSQAAERNAGIAEEARRQESAQRQVAETRSKEAIAAKIDAENAAVHAARKEAEAVAERDRATILLQRSIRSRLETERKSRAVTTRERQLETTKADLNLILVAALAYLIDDKVTETRNLEGFLKWSGFDPKRSKSNDKPAKLYSEALSTIILDLLNNSEAVPRDEKAMWLTLMPSMDSGKRTRLMTILIDERRKLAALEEKYVNTASDELKRATQQYQGRKPTPQKTADVLRKEILSKSATIISSGYPHIVKDTLSPFLKMTPTSRDEAQFVGETLLLLQSSIYRDLESPRPSSRFDRQEDEDKAKASAASAMTNVEKINASLDAHAQKWNLPFIAFRSAVARAEAELQRGMYDRGIDAYVHALRHAAALDPKSLDRDDARQVARTHWRLTELIDLATRTVVKSEVPSFHDLARKTFEWEKIALEKLQRLGDVRQHMSVTNSIVWRAATVPEFRKAIGIEQIDAVASRHENPPESTFTFLDTLAVYWCGVGRGDKAVAAYARILERAKKTKIEKLGFETTYDYLGMNAAIAACAAGKIDPDTHDWNQYSR